MDRPAISARTYLRLGSFLQHAVAICAYQGGVLGGKVGLSPSETTPNMTCILLMPWYAGSPINASHTAVKIASGDCDRHNIGA